jgi:alpha-glucosidase
MDYAGFTRPTWCWLGVGARDLPHFMGLPVDVPTLPAQAAVATMREVHAAVPWQSYVASTMHLDSHDSARFRTVVGGGSSGLVASTGAGQERHLVGLALQMTMPGVPVVFMGDEIGLTGVDGEHSRTPFPWQGRQDWDDETLAAYRTWIAVRREHIALRRGGLRWLAAEGDSITYLREHPDETVLVHLTRALCEPTVVPLRALGVHVRGCAVIQGIAPDLAGDRLVLSGEGPTASAMVVG